MEKVVSTLNQSHHAQTNREADRGAQAIYVGEGLPPVPPPLVEKIQGGEFVEMCELIPEYWIIQKGDEASAQRMTRTRGRKQSQNILVWVRCFAMYVAVVASKWPRRVPEMMAYMINIVKAHQEYEGLAWFLYDEAYRRQAAATGHTEWSKVNPSIFTVCFTAKAKEGKRCDWCLSLTHDSSECTRSEGEPSHAVRLLTGETGMGAATPGLGGRGPPMGYEMSEVCKLYNEGRCHYLRCKFKHLCRACNGEHPAVAKPDCQARVRGWSTTGPMRQGQSFRGRERGFPY